MLKLSERNFSVDINGAERRGVCVGNGVIERYGVSARRGNLELVADALSRLGGNDSVKLGLISVVRRDVYVLAAFGKNGYVRFIKGFFRIERDFFARCLFGRICKVVIGIRRQNRRGRNGYFFKIDLSRKQLQAERVVPRVKGERQPVRITEL